MSTREMEVEEDDLARQARLERARAEASATNARIKQYEYLGSQYEAGRQKRYPLEGSDIRARLSAAAQRYCVSDAKERLAIAQQFAMNAQMRQSFTAAVRAICGRNVSVTFKQKAPGKKGPKKQHDPRMRGYSMAKRILKGKQYKGKNLRLSRKAFRTLHTMADSANKDVSTYVAKAGELAKAAGRVTVNERIVNIMRACEGVGM